MGTAQRFLGHTGTRGPTMPALDGNQDKRVWPEGSRLQPQEEPVRFSIVTLARRSLLTRVLIWSKNCSPHWPCFLLLTAVAYTQLFLSLVECSIGNLGAHPSRGAEQFGSRRCAHRKLNDRVIDLQTSGFRGQLLTVQGEGFSGPPSRSWCSDAGPSPCSLGTPTSVAGPHL